MPEDTPAGNAPPLRTVPEAAEPRVGESGVPRGDTGWDEADAGDGPLAGGPSLWDRLNPGRLIADAGAGDYDSLHPPCNRLRNAGLL